MSSHKGKHRKPSNTKRNVARFAVAGAVVATPVAIAAPANAADWDMLAQQGAGRGSAQFQPPRRDGIVKDGDTLKLGSTTLKLYSTPGHTPEHLSFFVTDGVQGIAAGALRGLNDTRVPVLFAAVGFWLIGFTCAYGLAFPGGLGAVGIWIGFSIAVATFAALLVCRSHVLTSSEHGRRTTKDS